MESWVFRYPAPEPRGRALRLAGALLHERGEHIVRRHSGDLKLSYRAAGQPVDEAIAVVPAAMHFGGSREFFLCPGCGRRFAILYSVHGYFRCRRCNQMAYRTQNETPHGRALLMAGKLWKRAGCEWGGDGEKPKWMQWRTFNRLMGGRRKPTGLLDTPMMRRLMAEVGR